MRVELNPGEMVIANVLATMRNAVSRGSGTKDAKIGKQSALQTDLDGAVAEIAFAKAHNAYLDFSVAPKSGGHDLFVNGYKVDVKATRYQHGKLLATTKKTLGDAQIFVLGIVNDHVVTFAGWAWATDLLASENLSDLGYGPTYALDQDRLKRFTHVPKSKTA